MNSPSPTIQEQASEILRTLPARISDVVIALGGAFARQPCFGRSLRDLDLPATGFRNLRDAAAAVEVGRPTRAIAS